MQDAHVIVLSWNDYAYQSGWVDYALQLLVSAYAWPVSTTWAGTQCSTNVKAHCLGTAPQR